MDQKQKILEFSKTQMLCVISTVSPDGKPEAALVGIAETDNFEFIFGTSDTSRKYKNLQQNSHVAIVIGHDAKERRTVQIEGVATELEGAEADTYRDILLTKNPFAKKFAEKPDQKWFKVQPTWARYTNFADHEEFEITL